MKRIEQTSEILRKCPQSYLWLKEKNKWDSIDYDNLKRIENGETVISRIEPHGRNKKLMVTINGVTEVFPSMKKFADTVKVKRCVVTNALKGGFFVKGYKVERL